MKCKFSIGDDVRVVKPVDKRASYVGLYNRVGCVKKITTYKENNTIYVEFLNAYNASQEHGWFVYDESDLEKDNGLITTRWTTDDFEPYIKIKEEKKEMELLDLYFIRKRDELEVKYHEKREKIKRKDVMYTEVMDLRKKYAHIAEFNIYVTNCYKFSTEIETEIIKNDREFDKKLDELYCQQREIEAQLDICETYEQKMNVLKIYNVVDEKGKLNV